jgi:hypothetical protein
VGAGYRARRGLLPPMAPGQGQFGRTADSQGVSSLRPGELAACRRARTGVRPGRRLVLWRGERRRPRDGAGARSGHPRRGAQPLGARPAQ